jgi:hypothetical protein
VRELSNGSRDAVGCSADGRWVDFACDEEGGAVGPKLDPEGGEEVDEFEGVAPGTLLLSIGKRSAAMMKRTKVTMKPT